VHNFGLMNEMLCLSLPLDTCVRNRCTLLGCFIFYDVWPRLVPCHTFIYKIAIYVLQRQRRNYSKQLTVMTVPHLDRISEVYCLFYRLGFVPLQLSKCILWSSETLKVEVVCSSEMLVHSQKITWRNSEKTTTYIHIALKNSNPTTSKCC
jgi:hypothetical protein